MRITISLWIVSMLLVRGLAQDASQTLVGFRTDYYSFEEIARALSVGKRTVTCDPALRQRIALLSLKPRPWNEVRSLLEQGLDLEIVRISKEQDAWHLRRRKEVVQQERKLLDQLAQVLEKRLQQEYAQSGSLVSILRSLPRNLTEWDIQSALNWQESGEDGTWEELPEKPVPSSGALVAWVREQARLSKEQLEQVYGREMARTLLSLPEEKRVPVLLNYAGGLLRDMVYSTELLLGEWIYQQAHRTEYVRSVVWGQDGMRKHIRVPLGVETLRQLFWWRASSISAPLNGYLSYSFYPSDGAMSLVVRGQTFPGWVDGWGRVRLPLQKDWEEVGGDFYEKKRYADWRLRVSVRLNTKALGALFEEMDAEWARRYREATERHRALVQNPAYQAPVNLREQFQKVDFENSSVRRNFMEAFLYVWVEGFALQQGQEVVMELYPNRGNAKYSLRDVERFALAQVDGALAVQEDGYLGEGAGCGDGVWRVERVAGVWLWRNWLAFVDRQRDYPLVAIRDLYRSARSYADYERFYRQVSLKQARAMQGNSVFEYNTVNNTVVWLFGRGKRVVDDLRWAWIGMSLLKRIPNWERLLQERADKSKRDFWQLEVPLSEFPEALVRSFAHDIAVWMDTGLYGPVMEYMGSEVEVQAELVRWLLRDGLLTMYVQLDPKSQERSRKYRGIEIYVLLLETDVEGRRPVIALGGDLCFGDR